MSRIMIKNVVLSVVALAGLTVSATSQQRVESRLGRIATNMAQSQQAQRTNRPQERRADGRRVSRNTGSRDAYRPGRHQVYRPAARVTRYPVARRQVWVPGYWEVVRTPARYGWSIGLFGVRVWGVIEPACSTKVWRPGHWAVAAGGRRVVRTRY